MKTHSKGPYFSHLVLPGRNRETERAAAVQHIATATADRFMQSRLPGERLRQLQQISQLSDYLPYDDLQLLVGAALHDLDPSIRGEACYLVGRWSEVNKQKAEQFEPQIRRMSQYDSSPWVRKQAADAAKKLATISENTIDLELFAIADVYRKVQVLQEVSQRINDFDAETLQALIDYALHDPDPAIRGTASQLLQRWATIKVWKCTRFEPQVRRMAFHDPNSWVRKQAVAVAQKLYWLAFIRRWGEFILLSVILAVSLSLVAFPILWNMLSASVERGTLVAFLIVAMALPILSLLVLGIAGEPQLWIQEQRMSKNREITHPLSGELPRLRRRLEFARDELAQLEKHTDGSIPSDLASELSKRRALVAKLEEQIATIGSPLEDEVTWAQQ